MVDLQDGKNLLLGKRGTMSNQRHTWKEVQDFVGLPLGYCASNPNLLPLVNEASQLLFNAGDYLHKFARYRFRVGQNCCGARIITWPAEIETIEFLSINNTPVPVRNLPFEFIENAIGEIGKSDPAWNYGGPGWYDCNRFRILGDREEVCSFEDIEGPDNKLMAGSSLPADDGAWIILLGYDQNQQWIRTLQNGVYVDGEYLTLNAASPPTTANYFSTLKGVQFSVTPRNGVVNLVAVNEATGQQRTISSYQYNESVPIYRRSILSGTAFSKCLSVIALVRLRFIPIMFDTDYLQIGNLSALKDMMISLTKRDNGDAQNALAFKQMAMSALDDELRQYQGTAPKKVVSFQSRGLWGMAANMR
jgi:hypothetical protein